MYPVFFKIGEIPVHSYYVLWTVALSAGVFWTRRRAVKIYRLDDEVVRKTLILVFAGMLAGARIGGYFDHWSYYAANPVEIFNPLKGALSSTTAFLGGGMAGIYYLYRKKEKISPFAEAASLPAILTVAIGRVGCFLNGCCLGEPSRLPWALVFPSEKGAAILRHPVQVYYSLWYLVILFLLTVVEKRVNRRLFPESRPAILWPLFMILYGGSRFFIDFLRVGDRIYGLRTAQIVGIAVALAGIVWLILSLIKTKGHCKQPL